MELVAELCSGPAPTQAFASLTSRHAKTGLYVWSVAAAPSIGRLSSYIGKAVASSAKQSTVR